MRKYEELALLEEKIIQALCHMQAYQRKIACAFTKKMKLRLIKDRETVLK